MGRRHHRREDTPPPLDVTPADIVTPVRFKSNAEKLRERDERLDREIEERAAREERESRELSQSLDWSACLVPGCRHRVMGSSRSRDLLNIRLPLCYRHELMTWRRVQEIKGDDTVIKASQQLEDEARERDEEAKRRRLANRNGDIYFVRLNGLIKAGWSRELHARLRAYGPDVEVLCHYPGSRDDEANLHRNLRPFLARGREWYEDGPAMQEIIAGLVERHGQPKAAAHWTRPPEQPVKLRRR